jgi:hypothetical protein
MIERDEEWPTEADPIHVAICPLIAAVFELTDPHGAAPAVAELRERAKRCRISKNTKV